MRSKKLPILIALSLSMAMPLTACAPKVIRPSLTLTASDRTEAPDPPRPKFPQLAPPAQTGEQERAYLLEAVIRPLLDFSIAQESTVAAERQRANGLVAKVDGVNKAGKRKGWFRR